nr:MAG TPA: hypothetical protein [Caudoviricetes sp.]
MFFFRLLFYVRTLLRTVRFVVFFLLIIRLIA